jgi:prepilin-type processing-associated H-X9-DG protein
MDENLIGFALDALEPLERQQVEVLLERSPETQRELESVRLALEPLALDNAPIEPPAGLWERTMSRIAEQRESELARVAVRLPRSATASRSWYRRADVLVAATIAFALALLLPPVISRVRQEQTMVACQNNMRLFWNALHMYGDAHDHNLPDITRLGVAKEKQVAGMVVPALHGYLPEDAKLSCLAVADRRVPKVSMEDVRNMKTDEFEQYIRELSQLGYAYSLGYADDSGIHGLRLVSGDTNNAYLAVLADCPTTLVSAGPSANSANHGGQGQNVLYLDGHARFSTTRKAGVQGDDIYENINHEIAAGKHRWDTVLAGAQASP